MARLIKMKEIKGWEVLDEFYGKTIRGYYSELYGYTRSFCRCGDTDNQRRDKCEVCNNFDFSNVSENFYRNHSYYDRVIDTKYVHKNELTISGDYVLKVYEKKLCHDTDSARKYLEFKIETEEIAAFYKDKVENTTNRTYFYDYLNKNINDYKYWDRYEKYLKIFNDNEERNTRNLYNILDFQKNPKFMDDTKIFQFPNLAKLLIVNKHNEVENVSLTENAKKILNIDEEFLSMIDYALKNNTIYTYYLTSGKMKDFFNNLKKNYTGFEKLIKHYMINQVLSPSDALSTYEKIVGLYEGQSEKDLISVFGYGWEFYKPTGRYLSTDEKKRINLWEFFDKKYVKYFEIYFKENIHRIENKSLLVNEFISTIKNMIDLKIPIKEENFKLKTYNFFLNKHKFSEHYKLPNDKVDLFLDLFDINPMEALELVKNRRKLSKKELDDFVDYMSNLS